MVNRVLCACVCRTVCVRGGNARARERGAAWRGAARTAPAEICGEALLPQELVAAHHAPVLAHAGQAPKVPHRQEAQHAPVLVVACPPSANQPRATDSRHTHTPRTDTSMTTYTTGGCRLPIVMMSASGSSPMTLMMLTPSGSGAAISAWQEACRRACGACRAPCPRRRRYVRRGCVM